MKKLIAALLFLATAASAQTFHADDDRAVEMISGEGQSTVVAPGHPQCEFGRFITSSDNNPGHTGAIAYRDLRGPDTVTHISTFLSGPSTDDYDFGTSDHDLVSLSNGDVYYLTGVLSRAALPASVPWWQSAYRGSFGPGARGSLIVWRSKDCGATFEYVPELELDSARIGDGTCALPQNVAHYRHDGASSAHYVVPAETYAQSGDAHFRYCSQCKQLYYLDPSQPTACPLGGPHVNGGGNYKVTMTAVTGHVSETGFRRCKACGTLYRATAPHTACPAQMTHDGSGSAEYFLPMAAAGWHRCAKCQALFKDGAIGLCPAGGRHQAANNYAPPPASTNFAGQTNWHLCSKCNGLYLGNQAANVCPSGGTHTGAGVTYTLLTSKPDPQKLATEGGWRRCKYCGQLFKGDQQQASVCPLARPHDGTGSASYVLARESVTEPAELQPEWRVCSKCGSVYFSHYPDAVCPIGGVHETKIYDMGGSDGQVVHADAMTNRMVLTFRCVGRQQDKAFTDFTLSDSFLNNMYVATSEGGAPWQVAGVLPYNLWRTEVAALNAKTIALGFNDTMVYGTKAAAGWQFSPQTPSASPTHAEGWENFDQKVAPYANIDAIMWNHTMVARTPGTVANAIFVMPDTIGTRGHGYRLYFYDRATNSFVEATEPILPVSHKAGDVVFHLQAIDIGQGPVLLVWNDYDAVTQRIRIRGRFVIAEHTYTTDFDIAKAGGHVRTLGAGTKTNYGDYQTSDGYASSATTFVYHPMWIEPPAGKVHFGTVTYSATATAVPGTILTTVKAP